MTGSRPTRIGEDIVRIETDYFGERGLPLWVHAYEDGDHLVLLDAGIASTPEASIRPQLREAGRRIEEIRLVVMSHSHPDHQGGAGALADATGAQFAAPVEELSWFESNDAMIKAVIEPNADVYQLDAAGRASWERLLGRRVRINQPLRDGDEIGLATGGTLTVVSTRGQTPGHITIHDRRRGLLFTFDDVQGYGYDLADTDIMLPPVYQDVTEYRNGLNRLTKLGFDLMIPAHIAPLERPAALERIAASLSFQTEVGEVVSAFIRSHRVVGVRELAETIGTHWSFGGLNIQTMTVAKAHLTHLVSTGVLESRWISRAN